MLHQLVSAYWPNLRGRWDDDFEPTYGPLRRVVARTFDSYLECGLLERGFARLRCDSCGLELLLAFSCKTRGICPSCGKKRQLVFSRFVAQEVLEAVPHRQVVLTLPKRLRSFFATRRARLVRFAHAGYATLRQALRKATSSSDGQPGAITSIQTFGSLLDWHPHLHILISWGVFDRSGTFREASTCPRPEALQDDLRERVLSFLLQEEAIALDVVENMKSWPHSGFGAHIGADIPVSRGLDDICHAPANLLEYFVRPSVSLKRLERSPDGKVIVRSDRFHPKHQGNIRVFEPLAFLALLGMHIPDANARLVTYSGFYSNRARGERKKNRPASFDEGPPLSKSPAPPPKERDVASRWARLIAFVWEVDPLVCRCGGALVIVAVITSRIAVVRILEHCRGREPPGRAPPDTRLATSESERAPDVSREPFLDDLPWGEPTE